MTCYVDDEVEEEEVVVLIDNDQLNMMMTMIIMWYYYNNYVFFMVTSHIQKVRSIQSLLRKSTWRDCLILVRNTEKDYFCSVSFIAYEDSGYEWSFVRYKYLDVRPCLNQDANQASPNPHPTLLRRKCNFSMFPWIECVKQAQPVSIQWQTCSLYGTHLWF